MHVHGLEPFPSLALYNKFALNDFNVCRCVDESGERVEDPAITSRTLCIQNNLTWINPNINFDNVIIAMVALFQVVRSLFC